MVQPVASRRSVGPIAVQLGLITPEQLEIAKAAQRRQPGRPLDQILVDHKLLTVEQVRTIQAEMNRTPATPAAAKPPPGARGVAKSVPGTSNRAWMIAGAFALVPVLGLLAYFALKKGPEPAKPEVVADRTPKTASLPTDDRKIKEPTPLTPEPKVEVRRIRATLRKLTGHSDVAVRFNAAADKINSMRDPEQYKPVLADLEALIKDSAGTDYNEDIRESYKDVVEAIRMRGDEVVAFLTDEVARFSAAGKYGEALKSWDWFPGNLDLAGTYARKIEDQRRKTFDEGKAFFGRMTSEAETMIGAGKLADARLMLMRALEVGLPGLTEQAYSRINDLTKLEEAAAHKEIEAELAQFDRNKAEAKEASQKIAIYQDRLWELVSQRRLDAARDLFGKEKAGAPAEVSKALDGLLAALAELQRGFDLAAEGLKGQIGRTVSLAFLENGEEKPKSLQLTAIRDGKLVYLVGGRELTSPVADLHSSQLQKIAPGLPEADRDFLNGVARFLNGSFDEAHTILSVCGDRAKALVAFVEGSKTFLERNAVVLKERASRHMGAKEWERAVQIFNRLVELPAERKAALQGRSRAYYQLNNFVATVGDIESLFEMDDFSESTIELLNSSYKRATLIDKAARMLEAANKRVPENGQVLVNLVRLYLQRHDYDRATEAIKRAGSTRGISAGEFSRDIELIDVLRTGGFSGTPFKSQFGRYDVESDISQEFANRMARAMDGVYREYFKVFPYRKNETLRFKVRVFASEADFLRFHVRTGGRPMPPGSRLGAYYSPGAKQLVGFQLPTFEELQQTFTHEGLHQYIDYFVDDCPAWFNEGYASYFEHSTSETSRLHEFRHQTAKAMLQDGRFPALKDLFFMSLPKFQEYGHWMYGPAWAVIYYLNVNGMKGVLDRYFDALMEGKTYQQAFDTIFGPGKLNLEELEAKVRRAVNSGAYKEESK